MVKFICDRQAIKNKIKGRWNETLAPLAEQILSDCNEYVKVDTNTLRNSSASASNLKKGELVWNTPYAKRQYYTGQPRKDKNVNASLQWCEAAKSHHRVDWERIAQRLFDGR